jgi:putative MATE family efflux protein
MKKGLLTSYLDGIKDTQHGESYSTIIRYFIPEFISAFLLYSLPLFIDSYFISQLESTSLYAALGAANNFLHLIIKIAESFMVGIVIIAGQYNGMHDYKNAGHAARDAFWTICLVGIFFSLFLYGGAYYILVWYGIPTQMMEASVPFLRIRALGVFFTFLYMAIVGFLRAIKNTNVPMATFVLGSITFLFFDYVFIFGKFGFARMELQGSAIASVIQYATMFFAALIYVLWHKDYRQYQLELWRGITDIAYVKKLFALSWPVVLDKATMAWAYIWLCKMINPMGTCTVASFCVVKDMERFAFLPAVAFAQVITFLVSNDIGIHDWISVKSNLKKVCFLASMMVFSVLITFSLYPEPIMRFFDKKGEFTPMAAHAFPILSVLVFFDLVQLLLSGALRGAGNVKVVMYVRLLVCFAYFVPLSYLLSHMNFQDETLKFILVYGSFYFGNALMSIAYINRLRSEEWKMPALKGSV